MERLQVAIEKARAQRDTNAPAAGSAPNVNPGVPKAPAPPEAPANAWTALPEIKIKKGNLLRQRVLTYGDSSSQGSAAFDLLRTRMLQQAKQNNWRRIAIVSPHSGCGKTTTTSNLAFSLARQTDMRTIVFDFDLRRHGLSSLLRQKPKHGMADVLEGKVPFAEHGLRFGENVIFGFNRGSIKNASEVLQSSKAQQVIDGIQADFEPNIMLFDLPPLMASDDNFGFLQYMDAALILAAAEKTTMSQIDVAERQVAELTSVMGIVLNRCRYTTGGAYGHEYNYY